MQGVTIRVVLGARRGKILKVTEETTQSQPNVIIDPANPRAGRGGVVPPKPFPKGRSPNPGGYPAGWQPGDPVHALPGRWLGALADASCDDLEAIVSGGRRASTSKVAAARLILDAAYDDDPNVRRKALAEILDRVQGKSTQTTLTARVDARPRLAQEAVSRLSDSELATLERLLAKAGLTGASV